VIYSRHFILCISLVSSRHTQFLCKQLGQMKEQSRILLCFTLRLNVSGCHSNCCFIFFSLGGFFCKPIHISFFITQPLNMTHTRSNPLPSIRTTHSSLSPLTSPLTSNQSRKKRTCVMEHTSSPPPPNCVSHQNHSNRTQHHPDNSHGPTG
jgi:hypothetical protein